MYNCTSDILFTTDHWLPKKIYNQQELISSTRNNFRKYKMAVDKLLAYGTGKGRWELLFAFFFGQKVRGKGKLSLTKLSSNSHLCRMEFMDHLGQERSKPSPSNQSPMESHWIYHLSLESSLPSSSVFAVGIGCFFKKVVCKHEEKNARKNEDDLAEGKKYGTSTTVL